MASANAKVDANATSLLPEYETLVLEASRSGSNGSDWEKLEEELSETAEWTQEGARHLVSLARSYGSFMLRNSLALAVSADIEDGELGF